MSSSIFMRGDPLDLTQIFYLAYTSGSSTFLYCLNSSNYEYGSVTPTAGFLQMTSDYSDYSAVQFIITSLGNNSYAFQSGDLYLGLNSSNIIDLVSSISVAITFSSPSSNSEFNVYEIANSIYPGLPYANTINGLSYKWYVFTPTSSSSWDTYIISIQNISPFVFPVNNGQIAVWKVTSDYSSGACFYSTSDTNIGIEWLYNWMANTGDTASVNCDVQGAIDSTYNNCYFSDILACEAMYAYSLCSGIDTCGNCLGNTKSSVTQCRYNIAGSDPALFQSSTPVTSSVNNAVLLEDTSNDDDDGSSGGCSTGIVIIIIIIIIVLICVGIYYGVKSKDKNKSSSSMKNKAIPMYNGKNNMYRMNDSSIDSTYDNNRMNFNSIDSNIST